MAKIIDTNRHGIRREIDHSKKKKKTYEPQENKKTKKKK